MKEKYKLHCRQAEKALRWLAIQFSDVEEPKDDVDRLSALIHRNSKAGADVIQGLLFKGEQMMALIDRIEDWAETDEPGPGIRKMIAEWRKENNHE